MVKENDFPMEKLFGSKTRAKLLELFYTHTNKSFYVREITRVIGEQMNSVRRELTNLESMGVIKCETFDNKVYYAANLKNRFAHAFQEIFAPDSGMSARGARMVAAGAAPVRRTLSEGWDEYIKMVARYLRAMALLNRAPGQEGIDLLIIGDDRSKKLTNWAELVEKKQGKPLNYVIMQRDDFLYRKSVKDRFVMGILEMEMGEVYDPEGIVSLEEEC